MTNSPITDFLITIKNGYLANKKAISTPASKAKESVAAIMKKNNYIQAYEVEGIGVKKAIVVKLSYDNAIPVLTGVKIHSKPGRRVYTSSSKLPWGRTPSALFIISTSSGLLSQKEAQTRHLGGELIAEIW